MRQVLRLFKVCVCLCVAAVLLAACSGIPKPFSREKGWFNTSDPKAPPVTISAIDGAPKSSVDRIASQIYTESKRRGFNTTLGGNARSAITVKGHMTAAPTSKGTTVIYVWDVTSPDGTQKHRITGEETIPGGDAFADPWAAVDDSAMQRIAADTTQQLSLFISKLGYDARMASVPPPASMLSDQADSIQTASVTGTPPSPIEPAAATAAEQPAAEQPAAEAPRAEPAPAPKTQRKPEGKPTKQANAIAVPLVVGAKGRGNAELAAAMRRAMALAGVPVIKKKRNGAITVAGTVRLGPAVGSQQTVELAWQVLDAKGVEIGTISQKNQVPAGSLDKGWGQTAQLAAQAAAGGIFKLLSNVQ
jgi:hypothetical protein